MKKIISAVLSLALIFALAVPAFADSLVDSASDTIACAFTNFGWVAFTYSATYQETFTASTSSSSAFTNRIESYVVDSSINSAPATVNMSPAVRHYNSSGNVIHSYTMSRDAMVVPTGTFAFGHLSNSTRVVYPTTTTNYGSCGFSISGSTMVLPFSIALRTNLATDF